MIKPLPSTPFQLLIVAKTRLKNGFCVEGIAQNGRSVRLNLPDQLDSQGFHQGYEIGCEIGDVWRVSDYTVPEEIIAPHTEDINVLATEHLRTSDKLVNAIEKLMPPIAGGVEALFAGGVRAARNGMAYIGREHIPDYSMLFWRPDRPLSLHSTSAAKSYYVYPCDQGEIFFPYTGLAPVESSLPANMLICLSLARWWQPKDGARQEEGYYLQLTGWFDKPDSPSALWESLPLPEHDKNDWMTTNKPKALPPKRVPVSADLPQLLHQHFGFREFRPYQQPIVESVLARRDTMVIMSTGAGKSLCYQLPALVFTGLTVVISPLISLMQDQVAHLTQLGISAAALNSQLSEDQRYDVIYQARNGQLRLLYLSPEMLVRRDTIALLRDCQVECLVVDEAHCISRWGHDFREEYRQISSVREHLDNIPVLALTATATPQVRADIMQNLNLHDVAEFVAPFDRPNLFLGVQPRQDGLQQVRDFLGQHPNQAGIIYCATRNQVDELTAALNQAGIAALSYHAGLDDQVRAENQRRFIYDEVPVMVATVAFGMGIDKPDIRFVLNYNLPSDPENYYQQIGRAGRDGDRADCLMLYGPDDFRTIRWMISTRPADQQAQAMARLQHMSAWVQHTGCRRKWLINYFGDESAAEQCNLCDTCIAAEQQDPAGTDDLTPYARLFFTCVQQLKEKFGITHVIDVLRGSRARKILDWKHDQLGTYNEGNGLSKAQWQLLATQFFAQKLLVQNDVGAIRLTDSGKEVLKDQQVFGTLSRRHTAGQAASQGGDEGLFEQLRALRMRLAREHGIAPYMIFADRTLREMAAVLPKSEAELLEIHGVGEHKVEAYGAAFLEVIAAHGAVAQSQASTLAIPTLKGKSSTAVAQERRTIAIEGLQAGKLLDEVADACGVKPVTILRYLYKYYQEEGKLPGGLALPEAQVSEDIREQVFTLFAEQGTDALGPIYWAMDQGVEYMDLDLLRLAYLQLLDEQPAR